MLNQEQIGAYIAARRKAVGLTQAELGERLGITAHAGYGTFAGPCSDIGHLCG